jgi:hypothetical protein
MRDKDITTVNENVDNIIEKARNREIQIIEPTIDEFKQVRSVILDYIKQEKRIIYGGFAWNSLVKNVNPSDAFYKDTDYTDVEFYSNKPIEDMKKICDILYAKGFKFIQGKSAQHEDTYTIFVNFTAYCDISYMPSNVFYGVLTTNIDGYRLIHPKFIMVDILRQFNDPMTSFWRLDKNIKRGKLIMKNYPLELSTKPIDMATLSPDVVKLVNFIIPNLVKSKNILFIGQVANNAYINPNPDITNQVSVYDSRPLELISTNATKDIETLYNTIIKYFLDNKQPKGFDDNIVLEQYYPFFQFTDKKAVFKYKGETFLIIYGNNEKCIPYNEIKLIHNDKPYNIKIGTFNVNFMYNLVRFHQAYADKNKGVQALQDYIMSSLLTTRDEFLEANNLTVLDNSIFEDFKVNCLGDPISPMRKFMMSRRDRRLMPRSAIHPYDPEERKDNYDIDSYHFHNYSGNIINNPRDLIFNTKKDKDTTVKSDNA